MNQLSQALIVWLEGGPEAYPTPHDELVVARFGGSAEELLPRLRQIENDLYRSDAKDQFRDLARMGSAAAAHVASSHPELSPEALHVLGNLYAWVYK